MNVEAPHCFVWFGNRISIKAQRQAEKISVDADKALCRRCFKTRFPEKEPASLIADAKDFDDAVGAEA